MPTSSPVSPGTLGCLERGGTAVFLHGRQTPETWQQPQPPPHAFLTPLRGMSWSWGMTVAPALGASTSPTRASKSLARATRSRFAVFPSTTVDLE